MQITENSDTGECEPNFADLASSSATNIKSNKFKEIFLRLNLKKLDSAQINRTHVKKTNTTKKIRHPCTICKEIFYSKQLLKNHHHSVHKAVKNKSVNKAVEKKSVRKALEKTSAHKIVEKISVSKKVKKTSVHKILVKKTSVHKIVKKTSVSKKVEKISIPKTVKKPPVHTSVSNKGKKTSVHNTKVGKKSVHKEVENKFSCTWCAKTFSLELSYKEHLNVCQRITILHSCQICKDKFSKIELLEEHKLKNHDIRKFPLKCNHCTESYNEISQLRSHLTGKHVGTEEANAAALNLKSIKISAGKGQKYCNICKSSFKNDQILWKHMKIKHNLTEIPCLICQKMFTNRKERSQHYRSHKKCNDCSETFKTLDDLRKHNRNTHGKFSFQCEICGKNFLKLPTLASHYYHHVEISGPRTFCNICNKAFALRGSLLNHVKYCHLPTGRPKSHKCHHEKCEAAFINKFQLGQHLQKIHETELKFQCKICKKSFLGEDSLLSHHGRVHSAETQFKTTTTAKKITQSSANKIETTSCFSSECLHFTCPICNRTYEYKTHFERHLKTHSLSYYTDLYIEQQLPLVLKCRDPECHKRFSRMDNMLKHFKKYHDSKSKQYSPTFSICTVCKAEVNNVHIEQHRRRHHTKIILNSESMKDLNVFYNDEQKLFTCSVCQKTFTFEAQEDFIQHHITYHKGKIVIDKMKTGHNLLDFQCPTCLKILTSAATLSSHQQAVHVSLDKWKKCEKCHKSFKTGYDLNRHMKIHIRQKKSD